MHTNTANAQTPPRTPSTPTPLTAPATSVAPDGGFEPATSFCPPPAPTVPFTGDGGGGGDTEPGGGDSKGAGSTTPSPAAAYPATPSTPPLIAYGQILADPKAPTYTSLLSSSLATLSVANAQSRTMIVAWSPATPAPSAPALFAEKDESLMFAETRSIATAPPFFAAALPLKSHRSHVNAPPWTLTAPPEDASPSAVALLERKATSTA